MTIELKEVDHADVEQRMQNVYDSMSEKARRRYAAAEAIKLGYGGVAYIAKLFPSRVLSEIEASTKSSRIIDASRAVDCT